MGDLVSVVIPTYKTRGGLTKAIESALSQTGVDVEVIVIDDNNPLSEWRKKTEAEMSKFSNEDRVVYLKHPANRNGAAARNTGINASRGAYIAFLDDDDLFLPNKLKNQVTYLKSHPEFKAVYGQLIKSGRIVAENLPEGDLSRQLLMLRTHLQTSSLLFRADAIKAIKGFDEAYYRHQDYEMLLRYFNAGYKIGAIQVPVTEFGKNAGENIPYGQRLEDIKHKFLSDFSDYINKFNDETPGYRNAVFAKHYSSVFLSHVKHGYFILAVKTLKFSIKSPRNFWRPVLNSISSHLKGKV